MDASLPFLLSGLLFGLVAGMSPGPLLTLVISETLRRDEDVPEEYDVRVYHPGTGAGAAGVCDSVLQGWTGVPGGDLIYEWGHSGRLRCW